MLNPKIYGTLSQEQTRILKSLDIEELTSFFDICHTAREGAFAMVNSPEHRHVDQEMMETLFGNQLELLRNFLMEELEKRKPKTTRELEKRNESLCKWAMMCGSFPDAAKLLVELMSNENNLPSHIK